MAKLDPGLHLPYEIFANILSLLQPAHLHHTSLVSALWSERSGSNVVWDRLCNDLWDEKFYVPATFIEMKSRGEPKLAYEKSLRDYNRQFVTVDELCSFTWCFRFKEAAGEHWIENDPWWQGKTPHRMVFLPEGKTRYLENKDYDSRVSRAERRWKFVAHAAGRDGPEGSFIQVNNYPPYIVSRYKNGGFIMQSCWVVYTSFPLPPMGAALDLEDSALDVTTDVMSTEAMRYNIGVEFNVEDQAHIVNLLQLLAQIHHHNNNNPVNNDEDEQDDDDYNGQEDEQMDEGDDDDDENDYDHDNDDFNSDDEVMEDLEQ